MRRMLLVAASCLLPAAAAAQTPVLATGTWTGTITPPNGQTYNLVVETTYAADTLVMNMTVQDAPIPPLALLEPKVTPEGKLVFAFDVDVHVVCTLTKQAEGPNWEGGCVGDDGNNAPIMLIPPNRTGPGTR